jgi:hypothetical protein
LSRTTLLNTVVELVDLTIQFDVLGILIMSVNLTAFFHHLAEDLEDKIPIVEILQSKTISTAKRHGRWA